VKNKNDFLKERMNLISLDSIGILMTVKLRRY